MKESRLDIYFLVFASIFLFAIFVFFIIAFLGYYRKKRREHIINTELLERKFQEELLHSQLEVQEQAFNYISQEIHDNVGQILSLAKVQIGIMNESETMSKELLNDVKLNISTAMTDLRDISKSLNSDRIKTLSLLTVISNELDRINRFGVIQTSISILGEEKDLEEKRKLILFRIIQESIQNIIKHAQATLITISFNFQTKFVLITINDNGKGFDVENTFMKQSGLGLLNLRTRAKMVGGSCLIESKINLGSNIIIQIPYE